MSENVTTQSATLASAAPGEVFAFDDIAGVKVARSKTGFGAPGSYGDVHSGNPLPVVQTGTPTLPTGAATAAKQDTLIGHVDGIETLLTGIDSDTAAIAAAVAGTEVQVDIVGSLPAGTNAIGKLAANSGVDIGDVDVTSTVLPTANTQAAVTSVADTATSTTLLSSSGARKGFRITNTSSAVLYVKYGTTASATDFTVRLPQWAYLEENFYSGRVDAVWASDPGDGAALITSLSA